MFNFLTAVAPEARVEYRKAYRQYLIERDGVVDSVKRTLSKREAQMHRFESVVPQYSMDLELFEAQWNAFDASKPTTQEMLLVLMLCKLNAAEAYGVERSMRVAEKAARESEDAEIEMRVLVEEHYHTRILQSSAREYGLTITQPFQPPATLRGLIASVTAVPMELSRPLVLASELLGTLFFTQAFVKAGEILADKPELRDRIQERIEEILIDEIGHVTFNQIGLSSWGMFHARRLLPMVSIGMRGLSSAWRGLDVKTTTDLSWLNKLPSSVVRRAFLVKETAIYAGPAETLAAE